MSGKTRRHCSGEGFCWLCLPLCGSSRFILLLAGVFGDMGGNGNGNGNGAKKGGGAKRDGVSRALRGTQHGAQCIAETDMPVVVPVAAVRCCSIDGTSCISKVAGSCLPKLATPSEAFAACAAAGMRLCSQVELRSGVCCGTGCGYDIVDNWFTEQATAEPSPCDCAHDGVSGSTATNIKGCSTHEEAGAPWCYVNNPSACRSAAIKVSSRFVGAGWQYCHPAGSVGMQVTRTANSDVTMQQLLQASTPTQANTQSSLLSTAAARFRILMPNLKSQAQSDH